MRHQREQFQRVPPRRLVAGRRRIRRKRGHAERFGKKIAPLAQRAAVPRERKKHAAVRINAVFSEKIEAVPGGVQPFATRLNGAVERGQQPDEPAVNPDGFVRAEDASVAIQREQKSAAFAVNRMRKPERQRVPQQPVTVRGDQLLAFLR